MLSNFIVFQRADKFYQVCKSFELYPPLKDQLVRAASSICLNLAEGSARGSANDQRRFYLIAFGSQRECEAIFHIERVRHEEAENLLREIGAILHKLTKKHHSNQIPLKL